MKIPQNLKLISKPKTLLVMFENRFEPLLCKTKFYLRLLRSIALGLSIILIAVVIGMIGYHATEHMSWSDSFTHTAMLLSGMGALSIPQTETGKLFVGFYALFSGLIFVALIGIFFGPIVHRFLHRFHIGDQG